MKEFNKKANHYKKRKRYIKNILPLPITVLKIFGMWRSNNWSLFLKLLYSIITLFSLTSMILELITTFFMIYFSENPTQTFFKISFYIASFLCTLCKALGVVIKHDKIVLLLKMLLEDQCTPRDLDECDIQNKTDRHSRWVFKIYASMICMTLTSFFMEPVVKSGDEKISALCTYRPFDLKVPLFFWLTFFQQILTRSVTPWVHVSVECLIAGLMQQACAQIKILQHRLKTMPALVAKCKKREEYRHIDMEYILFTENVKHHIHILQFTKLLNRTFVEILFVQCFMSMALICCSVYQMSTQSIFSLYFINALLFNICMMIQLFLFCFYGNELMLQSTELKQTLYETDWTSLRIDTKSNIITMMIYTSKPIIISTCSVIKVNMSSFISIINASYSAFNVLQHAIKE